MKPLYLLGLIALSSTAACQQSGANATPTDLITLPMKPSVGEDKRVCKNKSATGLGTQELKAGAGAKPAATDLVLVNYIGYLAKDGAVFDQNQQAVFPVNQVVPGFGEGLQTMTKGSIARLCIPGKLGYAEKGAGADIPPNADLVFQVELVDFKSKAEVDAMQQQQGNPDAPAAPAAPPAPKK
jgi:FKBP-type peptidyl-prolyl cis-trans isomerase FkpA